MPNNLYCIHVPPEDDIGILFTKAKIMTVLISAVYGAAGNSCLDSRAVFIREMDVRMKICLGVVDVA